MIETEVKIKINNSKLEEMTYFLGNPEFFDQTNIFYQVGNGFLRLRREKGRTIITYKGEKIEDKFGSREEIELSLGGEEQIDVLRKIFGKIGMNETLYYHKTRAQFDFGRCKIFLDRTTKGNFIEIEAKYERDIEKAMRFFGLEEKDIEKRSYLEMLKNG